MERYYAPGCANEPKPPKPDRALEARRESELCGAELAMELRHSSRVGFALFAMLVISSALQIGAALLMRDYAPSLLERGWVFWAVSLLPSYAIGMPICYFLLRPLPSLAPEKRAAESGAWLRYFAIAMFLLYAGNLLGLFLNTALGNLLGRDMTNPVAELIEGSGMWASAIVTVLIAPPLEELIFRKLLMDRLLRYGERTAVLASALLFGLYHGNFSQFFYAALIGGFLAYLYAKTGRLRLTVLLHMGINLVGGVIGPLVAALSESGSAFADPVLTLYGLSLCGAFVAGLVLFIRLVRAASFAEGSVALPRGSRVPFAAPGMLALYLACGALFVLNTVL